MVLSLLFGKKYARTTVSNVVLDAVISEDHVYNSRVTNYPVEDGRIISDHIINEPVTLQITGVVSDTPLAIFAPFNRSINAFNDLVEVHNRRELITVVTGIKVYTNMVITSLQVPRNIQSGQSLTFVIDMQKVFLDTSVRLILNNNSPFEKTSAPIPRDQVADANKYPYIQADPVTSLKDQASTGIDSGIQDLVPVPTIILPRVRAQAAVLGAL